MVASPFKVKRTRLTPPPPLHQRPLCWAVTLFSTLMPRVRHLTVETPRRLENRKRPLIQTSVRGDPLPLNLHPTADRGRCFVVIDWV